MGTPTETMWEPIARFTPHLDQLQHKGEIISRETHRKKLPITMIVTQYWTKVATNLAQKFQNRHLVRSKINI